MTHRNLFRSITLTAGAALIGLASANAQAEVQAGNYQTHVLPSTTRHTADTDHNRDVHRDYQRVAEQRSQVQSGNYQTHVVPQSTRHDSVRSDVSDNRVTRDNDVAMSNARNR